MEKTSDNQKCENHNCTLKDTCKRYKFREGIPRREYAFRQNKDKTCDYYIKK